MEKKVSVVITAIAGEERYLSLCLSSVKKIASEIVIVDMSGLSEITKIGKKCGAKIYKHEFVNYVEPVRNFGVSKATSDWVLILDPDEEIGSNLSDRLTQITNEEGIDYVRVPRKNIVFGKTLKHSRWWPDYNIRFFKKGKVSWDEVIHAVPMTEGSGIDLEAKDDFAIKHHHYETLEQFIERMNRYTTVQARLKSKDEKFVWSDLITKPTAEFLSRFFAGEGYRDGVHGLALSMLQAFSELVVYLKIWQTQGFKEENLDIETTVFEFQKAKREFSYWENDALIKENGGILPRIRRKLRM